MLTEKDDLHCDHRKKNRKKARKPERKPERKMRLLPAAPCLCLSAIVAALLARAGRALRWNWVARNLHINSIDPDVPYSTNMERSRLLHSTLTDVRIAAHRPPSSPQPAQTATPPPTYRLIMDPNWLEDADTTGNMPNNVSDPQSKRKWK